MAYWLERILEVGAATKTKRDESPGNAKNVLIWECMNRILATGAQRWAVVENVTSLTTATEDDISGAGNTG